MKNNCEPKNPEKQAKEIDEMTKRLMYILVYLYIFRVFLVKRVRYEHDDVQYSPVRFKILQKAFIPTRKKIIAITVYS